MTESIQQLLRTTNSATLPTEKIAGLSRLIQRKAISNLSTILPLCLSLRGRPYSLTDHAPFEPMYATAMPTNVVFKTGRQVAKSTNMAAHAVIMANCIPFFSTLVVMPLFEQARRFSTNYVRPFVDTSPLREHWAGPGTGKSVPQRSFQNQSMIIFSYALLDTERIRGISSDKMVIDEVQDMDPDHIPIIRETMSASKYKLSQFCGTPKSLDNPIEGLWSQSSQAEWAIKCSHCSFWNIAAREYHLEGMIGPYHPHISERYPATICYRCRQPISPRYGCWLHRHKDRRASFAGYHMPQLLLPMHFASAKDWTSLLFKQGGGGNTSSSTFWNEVMGEGVDSGQKLVSETELKAASVLPWKNLPDTPDRKIQELLPHYKTRVLAVDWGGGGEQGVSFTVAALLGFTTTGKVHVLWGKRFVLSQDHLKEAKELLRWASRFNVDIIAHDYSGAGVIRETVMVQAGFQLDRLMPIQYVRSAAASMLVHVPATVLHNRSHYSLDKTRSLLYACQAIKTGLLQFFQYDRETRGNIVIPGLIGDFLALVEEKRETRQAGDTYTITRNLILSDDFAQAVNIGCAALWHVNQAWPNFADAADVQRHSNNRYELRGKFDWDETPNSQFFNPV